MTDMADGSFGVSIDVIHNVSIFGHVSDDSNGELMSLTNINASLFQANGNGAGTKITAKVGTSSGGGNCKCAIYDSNRNLLAYTETISVSGSASWTDFDLISEPSIIDGNYYWLAIWSNYNRSFCRTKSLSYKNVLATWSPWNGWPSSLGGSPIVNSEMLIYCTYKA
jgi:hypothetical protein